MTNCIAAMQVEMQPDFEVPGQGLIAPHVAGIAMV